MSSPRNLVVALALLMGFMLMPGCRRNRGEPTAVDPGAVIVAPPDTPPVKSPPTFSRRMLFIHIGKYMFLNPLTHAEVKNNIVGADRTKPAAKRLALEWNVPSSDDPKNPDANQLFLLSDTAPPDNPRVAPADQPLLAKNVVMGAYDQFFATSRGQDRIVVYFGGHAVEKGGKAYLASVEGDLDDETSLIPLSDFYDKLKACKATQKLVIWDVCRYNPQRGRQRPGSEPMTEGLYKALATAPPGVQVITTCQPGENALEFYNLQPPDAPSGSAAFAGSAFLDSVRYVASKNVKEKLVKPDFADPIPVADITPAVATKVSELAGYGNADTDGKAKLRQSVTLHGSHPEKLTPPDPSEPLAERFAFPAAPKGIAPADVAEIVRETEVPPLRSDLTVTDVTALAFRAEVMKAYRDDVPLPEILANEGKYPLRVATLTALGTVRRLWRVGPDAVSGPTLRDSIPGIVDGKLKQAIEAEREWWTDTIAELKADNAELDKISALRDAETKRWQANYDTARAAVKSRLAFALEYNRILADVIAEKLPELDPKLRQDRYRLVSQPKPTHPEAAKLAAEAAKLYDQIIVEHNKTPWAFQAKREKAVTLGLSWKPISSGDTTDGK